jgi:regulatory factor X
VSRASTTSVHSFEHFQPQQHQQRPTQFAPQPQYNAAYTSEPLQPALLQAAQHVSAQDNLMNMSLESVQQYLGYPSESTPQPSQSQPNGLPMDSASFHTSVGPHSQQQQHFMAPPMDSEDKKKKSSASGSATNDKELRQLLAQNENRNLKDVAQEVIQNDRTSKAEKSKQLFAMLWSVAVICTCHVHPLTFVGYAPSAPPQRHRSRAIVSTPNMPTAAAPIVSSL